MGELFLKRHTKEDERLKVTSSLSSFLKVRTGSA